MLQAHNHCNHGQRRSLEALNLKKHPEWSHRRIAQRLQCSHTFVSKWLARFAHGALLTDSPRSGTPRKAVAAAVQHIVTAAQHPDCRAAADIAAKVQQDHGLQFIISVVRAVLRGSGMHHLPLRPVSLLSVRHRKTRVRFAKTYLRRDRASKRRFLCTDSKSVSAEQAGQGFTQMVLSSSKRHCSKAQAQHCSSYPGSTKLMFVTGTHKQPSKFVRPKTKRLYAGVVIPCPATNIEVL